MSPFFQVRSWHIVKDDIVIIMLNIKYLLMRVDKKLRGHYNSIVIVFTLFVRLSLLTMTNPNQLCDVLLFVCSKMADQTNLSSKLPVADRAREV